MHQGRPYGLHVIGGKLTDRDEAFVSVTAKRFSNLKDLSSIDSSRMVYDLPDGGYVVIQDMGNNFRVIAHKTSEIALIAIDGMATDYIPMLYSGVILNSTPFESDGVPIRLTETARRRLIDYSGDKELPPKEIALHRFRIEYDDKFKYFEPIYKGIRTFTQYHKLRATWYSGAMSEVMQVIGGYGRQDSDDLPDKPLERKRFKLPASVNKSVRAYIANQRLPAYSGIPDFEGKVKYEYSHRLTNTVSFDSAGKPWLLQIDPRGVYAMPLPIIPATTAPAFLSYLREVVDDELIHIVERFGGLPSGEIFPTGDDFQAWYRAGVIIRICDTSEFYKHSPFYEACGWSFNSQGSEGFNTGWSFDDSGLRHAHGFKVRLRLGAAREISWVLNAKQSNDPIDDALLNRYISGLFRQLSGNGHRERAIRYKIMRTPAHVLISYARVNYGDIEYWENLIDKPIANHQGSVSQVSSGPMYWGNPSPKSFGALKFPEFTGQGCASFDVTMPDYKGGKVRCDTVIFGCYVNDELTVIKYFIDDREFQKTTESSFEKVMIVGQWEETKAIGSSGLMGYLYTTAFDDRREASDRVTYTKITGSDLGYGGTQYSMPPLIYMWGSISRSRYYSFKTEIATNSGDNLSVALCVPTFARDSMLYAFTENSDKQSYSEKMERKSVADPTSYTLWTYDSAFHFIGNRGKGEPIPTIGQYVYANAGKHEVNEYSWFADSGNWYGLTGDYKDESGRLSKYTGRNSGAATGVVIGGAPPSLETYETLETKYSLQSGRVSVSIKTKGSGGIHKEIPDEWYYAFSPIDAGGSPTYFYRDATWITCGTQKYSSTSETKANGLRSYWGSTKLADHKSAHCFIGVINE